MDKVKPTSSDHREAMCVPGLFNWARRAPSTPDEMHIVYELSQIIDRCVPRVDGIPMLIGTIYASQC